MPDISLCNNHGCLKAPYCYRYIAEPGLNQDYRDFVPHADGTCDDFLRLDLGTVKINRERMLNWQANHLHYMRAQRSKGEG